VDLIETKEQRPERGRDVYVTDGEVWAAAVYEGTSWIMDGETVSGDATFCKWWCYAEGWTLSSVEVPEAGYIVVASDGEEVKRVEWGSMSEWPLWRWPVSAEVESDLSVLWEDADDEMRVNMICSIIYTADDPSDFRSKLVLLINEDEFVEACV
jgi:hypothetical protein